MARISGRHRPGQSCVVALASFLLSSPFLSAQPMQGAQAPGPAARPAAFSPSPMPADVLTPNKRQNTPYLKIAARAGLNWAAYSNDRWLDNTALDVGRTSGEYDVYSNASGFGYVGGAEVEYPLSTGFSVVGSIEFVRAEFGRVGIVDQESVTADGSDGVSRARHDWSARLSYLKFGAVAKLSFQTFYVTAGLTADRLLSSQILRTRAFDDASVTFPDGGGNRIEEDAPMVDPAGLHFAIRTGVGLVYSVGERLQFSPELTLDFGTSSINKSPESDLDIYSLSAVLRYELR